MKSFNTKLALTAVAVAILATPALAARSHARVSAQPSYDAAQSGQQQIGSYPNGASKTGTAENVQDGAAFNVLKND
jgi:hypothetical protein